MRETLKKRHIKQKIASILAVVLAFTAVSFTGAGPVMVQAAEKTAEKMVSSEAELAAYFNGSHTIVLTEDIVLTVNLTHNSGIVTLDLNGHTITMNEGVSFASRAGVFHIKDTVGTGQIISKGSNDTLLTTSGSLVHISGGTFKAGWSVLSVDGNSEVTITGGTFEAAHRTIALNGGALKITDGTFMAQENADAALYAEKGMGSSLAVWGGNFIAEGKLAAHLEDRDSMTVYAGSFLSKKEQGHGFGVPSVLGTMDDILLYVDRHAAVSHTQTVQADGMTYTGNAFTVSRQPEKNDIYINETVFGTVAYNAQVQAQSGVLFNKSGEHIVVTDIALDKAGADIFSIKKAADTLQLAAGEHKKIYDIALKKDAVPGTYTADIIVTYVKSGGKPQTVHTTVSVIIEKKQETEPTPPVKVHVITDGGILGVTAGTQYRFGSGKWRVTGDNTIYEGDTFFYTTTSEDLEIQRQ